MPDWNAEIIPAIQGNKWRRSMSAVGADPRVQELSRIMTELIKE